MCKETEIDLTNHSSTYSFASSAAREQINSHKMSPFGHAAVTQPA